MAGVNPIADLADELEQKSADRERYLHDKAVDLINVTASGRLAVQIYRDKASMQRERIKAKTALQRERIKARARLAEIDRRHTLRMMELSARHAASQPASQPQPTTASQPASQPRGYAIGYAVGQVLRLAVMAIFLAVAGCMAFFAWCGAGALWGVGALAILLLVLKSHA